MWRLLKLKDQPPHPPPRTMPRTPHRAPSKPKKAPGSSKPDKAKAGKKKKVVSSKPPAAVQKLLDEPLKSRHLVTRAALKRAACRAGIRCISKECIESLVKLFDDKADECLLHAKNNACYVRNAKTLASTDIVAGSRECGMGDVLVC